MNVIMNADEPGSLEVSVRYGSRMPGNVRLVATVKNQQLTPRQSTYATSLVISGTNQAPTSLPGAGVVNLTVGLASFCSSSSAYDLRIYVLPEHGGWGDRFATAGPHRFAIDSLTTTTVSTSTHTSTSTTVTETSVTGTTVTGTTITVTSAPFIHIGNGDHVTVNKAAGQSVGFDIPIVYNSYAVTNVSFVVLVTNAEYAPRGYLTSTFISGTNDAPNNLLPSGSVTLSVRLGSWSPLSSRYAVRVVSIPAGGNWVDRSSPSNELTLSLIIPPVTTTLSPTHAPTPACQDLSVGRSNWHNGINRGFNCSFFAQNSICGFDGGPGLGDLTSNIACCACGGGASGNFIDIISAPIAVTVFPGSAPIVMLTVRYNSDITNLVRIVVTMTGPTGRLGITSLSVDQSTASELPAAGIANVTARLRSNTLPTADVSVAVSLLPSAGSWSDRVATSTPVSLDLVQPGIRITLARPPTEIVKVNSRQTLLPLRLSYDAGANFTGLLRIIVVVRNTLLSQQRGYVSQVLVSGTRETPSNLHSRGEIDLEARIGSWSPVSSGYEVFVALVPQEAGWSDRIAESTLYTFALVSPSGAHEHRGGPSVGITATQTTDTGGAGQTVGPPVTGLIIGALFAVVLLATVLIKGSRAHGSSKVASVVLDLQPQQTHAAVAV